MKLSFNPETFWAAVSAVGTIVAVFAAIRIPKKIANQQNKIALFEKRLECYTILNSLMQLSEELSDLDSYHEISATFSYWVSPKHKIKYYNPIDKNKMQIIKLDQYLSTEAMLEAYKKTIYSGEFIFSNYDVDSAIKLIDSAYAINEAFNSSAITTDMSAEASVIKIKDDFVSNCEYFSKNYMQQIKSDLNLIKQ